MSYVFDPWSIPYFVSFLVSLVLVGLLIKMKRDEPHVRLYIVFMLSLVVLTFAAGMATSSRDIGIWDFWWTTMNVSASLAITSIFHFAYVSYTNKGVLENKTILSVYLVTIFFSGFLIWNPRHWIGPSADSDMGVYGKVFEGPYEIYDGLWMLSVTTFLILAAIYFYRMYRESVEGRQKMNALIFLMASVPPLAGFVVTFLLVDVLRINIQVQLAIVMVAATGAIITYGILRHQLFEIELIVKKTLVFTLLVLILVGIFRLIELAISYTVSTAFFGGDVMARLIAAAIVAAFFLPFRKVAMGLGDKLFPSLASTIKLDDKKAIAIYRLQLEHVLEDGTITEKERRGLITLQEGLGLSGEEATAVELELNDDRESRNS
jgi:hypothetical protein